MALLGDDCYFFCTSNCAKGTACPFRHVETAKTAKIICQHWQMGHCTRPLCKFRHSTFEIPLSVKSETQSYWETQPSGCTRAGCMYKHLKPRPGQQTSSGEAPTVTSTAVASAAKPASSDFVVPQVQPVVIQPADSEESNSSPAKKVVQTVPTADVKEQKLETAQNIKEITNGKQNTSQEVKSAAEKPQQETEAVEGSSPKPKKVIKKKVVKKVKAAAGGVKTVKKTVPAAGTTKKVVKKVKAKTPTQPAPTKVKKVVKPLSAKSAPAQSKVASDTGRKSVKDRLGLGKKPAPGPVRNSEEDESSSSSDSDDSIENIKVIPMEEILRRKALESMMKKRAAEGKELLPEPAPQKSNIIKLNKNKPHQLPPAPRQRLQKPVNAASRVNPRFAREREKSDSDDEEEEEENESPEEKDLSSKSSSSDSDSSSSSEDSSDSEPEVRRVVVADDVEKAARKRAKASLMSKQRLQERMGAEKGLHRTIAGRIGKAAGNKAQNRLLSGALDALGQKSTKTGKKRTINVDYDSDDVMSKARKPLSIRDRLGKQPSLTKPMGVLERASQLTEAIDAGVSSAGESSPHRVRVPKATSYSDGERDGDDDDGLSGIKVKSLAEIKQEKLRKQAEQDSESDKSLSPIRKRLNMSDEEEKKGRQIIVTDVKPVNNDTLQEEQQKKQKRRPWRTQKVGSVKALTEPEDTRVAVAEDAQSPPRGFDVDEKEKAVPEVEESPFEMLKRRALMKKMQKKQEALLEKEGEEATKKEKEEEEDEEKEEEGKSGKSRKHKHKHKHKHSKKSKKERQIYMPPGMKNSTVALVHPTRQAGSPETSNDITEEVDTEFSRPPAKRGRHPIAAAWAAGLALSSKGTLSRRPPEPTPIVGRGSVTEKSSILSTKEKPSILSAKEKPTMLLAKERLSKPAAPKITLGDDGDLPSGVVIKSFSEIMAEKRRRRLELQAQKTGGLSSATSGDGFTSENSSSPIKSEGSKPRAPITPIIFDIESPSKEKSSLNTSPLRPAVSVVPPTSHGDSAAELTFKDNQGNSEASQHFRLKSNTSPTKITQETAALRRSKKLFKKKKSVDNLSGMDMEKSNDPAFTLSLSTSSSFPRVPSQASHDTVVFSNAFRTTGPAGSHSTVVSPFSFAAGSQGSNMMKISSESVVVSPESMRDAKPLTATTPAAVKHKAPLIEAEVPQKKSRLSLDDELNLLEDEIDDEIESVNKEESIDDLLANIDDLLA